MTVSRTNIESLLTLDRVIHEPARLVILTVLAEAEEVEFKFLEQITRLTRGNLSSHLAKLEVAGYLQVKKWFRGKIPATSLRITKIGRKALGDYRSQVQLAAAPGIVPGSRRTRK
jgi:DNA-binding transcriptional ArsR family regulator